MSFVSAIRQRMAACVLVMSCLTTPFVQAEDLSQIKPESTDLRMGLNAWIGYGPWLIAQQKGLFKKNGLDGVQISNFNEDKDRLAAFASGQIDFMNLPTQAVLQLAESGVAVKIVLLLDFSLDADAIIADKVASIADLKGKRVAYEESSTSDILLNYALAKNGMSIADIERVPMSASQAGTALVAGQVPVAVTYEPYISAAMAANPDVKLLYSAGAEPGLISDVLVVSERAWKEKRGQIMALVRSWQDAIAEYQKDVPAGRQMIAKGVGSPVSDLETAFNGVQFYSVADNQQALSGTFSQKTLGDVKQAAQLAKIISSDVDTTNLIDDSFVKAVK